MACLWGSRCLCFFSCAQLLFQILSLQEASPNRDNHLLESPICACDNTCLRLDVLKSFSMLEFLAALWRKRTVGTIKFFSVHMRTAQMPWSSQQERSVESFYAGKLGRLVSPSLNIGNLIIDTKKETGGPISQEDTRHPFGITGNDFLNNHASNMIQWVNF